MELRMTLALCLTALSLSPNLCAAFLNIEELSNTRYSLDILSKPINEIEIIPTEGLKLGSKHGQSYFCTLPKETGSTAEKEEENIPKSTPISSLLQPLRHEECLKIAKGWWTYEFCYGKYVKQYHAEGNEKKGDVTYLGYYESDFDWNKENLDETYNYKRHKFNRYHSQSYVNGTACDVINHLRDTEIRYICEDSSTETYIERVDEPSTCSYILTIRTPYVCSHPHTRPMRTPKPIDIICRPVLSTEDFERFEENEKAQKARDEAFFHYAAAAKKMRQTRQIFQAEKEVLADKPLMDTQEAAKSWADVEDMFFTQLLQMFDPKNLLKSEEDEKKKKESEDVPATKGTVSEDASDGDAIKMIERFIVGERLQNLKPFQQRRLVQDVKDLLKLKSHLPTADQARAVEKYASDFVGSLEDMMLSEEEAADYQQRMIRGLNTQLMDDLANFPLPDLEEEVKDEDDEENEDDEKDSKPRLSVNVKVHQLKSMEDLDNLKAEDILKTEEDPKDYDPSWKKLEEDIGQGLEDAGFHTEGGHVEIRLVTNSDALGESLKLNSEEGERFRQMLLELVGGGAARKHAVKRQKSLHDNYNLVWEKGTSRFKVLDQFEEDNEKDSEVKSPRFQL